MRRERRGRILRVVVGGFTYCNVVSECGCERHKLVSTATVQGLKMFPVAATGGPVLPAVVEAKARRRRERKLRNLKGIQDDRVRKERLENRQQLSKPVSKPAEPQRIDDLTQLKIWLGRGLFKFHQVQNANPGWIVAYEIGEGLRMSEDQYRMYNQASRMGLAVGVFLGAPVWWQVGILKYPPVQQTLSSVGFDQFVNFFGGVEPRWAMEIPVAIELGLFVTAWVNPIPLKDWDWDEGGAGPFITSASSSMIEEGPVDPAAAAMNEERENEAQEYTANRLKQPGAAEADRHLNPFHPTLMVDVPPSDAAAQTTEVEGALFEWDPPPSPGLTVAQVQQAAAEKQATHPSPAPTEYHSITDYMKTSMGRNALDALTMGVGADFKSMTRAWLPTIAMREKFFFVRVAKEFSPGTRAAAFFSDNQTPIQEPDINLGTAYGNPIDFTMEDVFIQTVKANGKQTYSVAADEPESFGLFGYKQMEHMYEHLFLKAKPLFSVSPDKAVQFFPSSYVCSNVWWWESKLEKLPIGTSWKQIGRGGYNYAFRLEIEGFTPGEAALAFLPPGYAAYDAGTALRWRAPSMVQHGLIKRVAWVNNKTVSNITTCMRELYLAGYAASCGVGPKILAAYIQPGGTRSGFVPDIRMNPGDSEERFANPLYETKRVSKSEPVWNETDSPPEGWFVRDGKSWSDTVTDHNDGFEVTVNDFHPSYNLHVKKPDISTLYTPDPRAAGWKKMVVLMESYEGDMQKFQMPPTAGQRKKVVEALMQTFYKMGEAGILHCDIKSPNVVYRTWKTGESVGWSNIETMAIDFDPEFVKVVPWLPGPVIALINAACFFAYDACFHKHRFQKYTMEPLKKLHKEVMDNYPDGVAEAFRALLPSQEDDLPFEDRTEEQPHWLGSLFNDEYETALTLFHWLKMYLNKSCSEWMFVHHQAPPNSSMLARLLAMAQHRDPSRALNPPDAMKRGNFPFELHADPQVRMRMAAQASASVWGGLTFNPPETSNGWDSGWDSGWDDSRRPLGCTDPRSWYEQVQHTTAERRPWLLPIRYVPDRPAAACPWRRDRLRRRPRRHFYGRPAGFGKPPRLGSARCVAERRPCQHPSE